MKKAFLLFLVILMALTMASCDMVLGGNGGQATTTEKGGFDANHVTLATAYSTAQSLGFEGTLDEFVEMISGKDGVDGKDGKDGVGITSVLLDSNGDLLVILSDGRTINCGNVKGKDGADGKTPYIQNGYWYIDGVNTGVKAEGKDGADGADGTPGRPGATGKDGADGKDGITPTFKIENGELFVSYDNGASWSLLGTVQGVDGEDGKDGVDGTNGTDGKDGATGATGVGIEKVEFDENGDLLITFTDGSTQTVAMPEKEEHVHTFGEYINYVGNATVSCEERLFYRICSGCKVIEWQNGSYENHEFVTKTVAPTCIAEGYDENTCSVCGLVEKANYTPIAGHSYEEAYSYNASFHWLDCTQCDSITAYAEHSVDDSGFCTVCDQPLAPTEGLLYELSADGAYASVIGYEGTATRVVIADTYMDVPVTHIHQEAFDRNKTITAIVISNSVTTIGSDAFYYCSKLTSVTMGDNVTTIGYRAFYGCNSALYTEYEYGKYIGDAENSYAVLVELTNKNLSIYTIHADTKIIAYGVFRECARLTSITIPDGVTAIGSYAFNDCDGLISVTIGDGVTEIGTGAFNDCDGLISVTIGGGVTKIGTSAFEDCDNLKTINYCGGKEEWTAIEKEFGYKPSDCTIACNYNPLTQGVLYEVSADGAYASVVGYVGAATDIVINDTYEGVPVTNISDGAFKNNKSITTVVIPDSVITIGNWGFQSCFNLTSITIPDSIITIGDCAFYECSRLASVTIGDSVTAIGYYAFYNCVSLASIIIPDSVTTIGKYAFDLCYCLKTINYRGTEAEWAAVEKSDADIPSDCTIVYNYSGE